MDGKMREELFAELTDYLSHSGFALDANEDAAVRAIIDRHLAQQPVSVPEETAWLIEMREGIHPVKWLGGTKVHYPWTTDAMAAVRFKGRKDAQYVIDNCPPFYPGGAELFATEHIFMLSAAPQEDQP